MKKIAIFLSAASLLAGCGDNGRDGLATGTFDAVELIVSNEVPGKIVRLDVSEGDAISDGQLIGLMDTVQLDLQMRALLKNIDAMYSQRPDNCFLYTSPSLRDLSKYRMPASA
mgnify:CR=1 FL=1